MSKSFSRERKTRAFQAFGPSKWGCNVFFLKKLAGLLYFLIMIASGTVFICVILTAVPSALFTEAVEVVRADLYLSIVAGLAGLMAIVSGVSVLIKSRKNKGRNRLITFQNPDGEVTVSISAIENYVQRVAKSIPGIAEVKASAKVGKKGIAIVSFVAVSAGTNIPEVTENIQMTVKSKVQDMLGVEEKITVTMHITKILKDTGETVNDDEAESKPVSPPFREID
jgi:uncharacterized alkaline shock family protein YloU